MNPIELEQVGQLSGRSIAIAFRESFLGMFAAWLGLQLTYFVMCLADVAFKRSDWEWFLTWGKPTGGVCLIAWLLFCWPATLVFRGRLLKAEMGMWQGALIGGVYGGLVFSVWVMIDSSGGLTRGTVVLSLLAAMAGAISGWVISWRTIRQRRKDAISINGN